MRSILSFHGFGVNESIYLYDLTIKYVQSFDSVFCGYLNSPENIVVVDHGLHVVSPFPVGSRHQSQANLW